MAEPTLIANDLLDAIRNDEPIYVLPPIEREPEISIRADFLAESRDWGHAPLGLAKLHEDGIRGEGVLIAICDTGIDIGHDDLKDRIHPLGNKDFTGSSSGFTDYQGHGTHCAGISAASSNGKGMIGAAPAAKLIAVKVLSDEGAGTSSWIAAGIRHAADAGADIINLSLGGSRQDNQTRQAIQYAISKGCWVVAAAGNDGRQATSYPGHYPETCAVAAVDRAIERASFSTINEQNDIAAPGVSIMSTLPDGRYGSMSGTSMATPYIAGCLALVRSELKRVGASVTQAKMMAALKKTARDIAPSGTDSGTGSGLINTEALLAELMPATPPPPPPPPPPGDKQRITIEVDGQITGARVMSVSL